MTRRVLRGPRNQVSLLGATFLIACSAGGSGDTGAPALTRAELLNPVRCKDCHPKHYREWASSMHAYASVDPVFRAMNNRGQRETGGQLGDFCVKCHAPMAVREGATTDGLDLDEVPDRLTGVTCYFCHDAVGVRDHYDNGVDLADDTTMRGGIADPVKPRAHGVAYSRYHDRNARESTLLCGGCHDIVTQSGVHLERTLAEYESGLFSKEPGFDTCNGCHMDPTPGVAADDPATRVPSRMVHEHLWPGVDTALTDFPDRRTQARAIECALGLNARIAAITSDGLGGFTLRLETSAGHNQPSGASQDRRLWLELIAYDKDSKVLFRSGDIADGQVEARAPGESGYDPQLTLLRDWIYDAQAKPAHMFWNAAPSDQYPDGYRSSSLPVAIEPMAPHSIYATYQVPHASDIVRVTARLRVRPMGLDVLEDLVTSGDLDANLLAAVPTFTLYGAAYEWTPDKTVLKPLWPDDLSCPESYRCLLQPDAPECAHN